ncbi:MAG: DUF4292 domain-containing protein [Myxococcota bacterium]
MNRLLLSIFLLVLFTGCPRRIDFGPKGEVTDARELLKLTSFEESQVYSVQGEAKIRVDTPQGKGVATLFMAVSHPSLLRLESLDFFGKPTAVLVSDGQRFGLFQAEEGKYYTGPSSPQNISRFLPLVLAPEELTALMLGRAPRIPAERVELKVDVEERRYVLILTSGPVTQTLHIHLQNHRVLVSEVRGVNSYDLAFENIDSVKGVTYPRRVLLEAPGASTELELNYKDVEVNSAPDLTMFELEPPANVPVIEVDALGQPVPPSAAREASP